MSEEEGREKLALLVDNFEEVLRTESLTFLPDEPIKSESEDQFAHSTFVNKLLWLIESTQEHFNIGIFGKWGTGKTGILNMLKKKLGQEPYDERYDYIYVDTWKLSKDSLRQQLLYQLSRKYDPSKSEEEIADRLFHTTVEPIKDGKKSLKERFKKLLEEVLPYLLIAIGLIILGFVADSLLPERNLLPIISSLFVVPLVISLIKRLAETSRAVSRSGKRIIPRIESPFQFADMFHEIIGERKEGKKTIIALDNLDRCQSDLVVEMLSTVKAFMETEGVVFVVACDDEALVQHLTEMKGFKEEDAREFLRKFFQRSITIPPFIEGDLLKYVDGLTSKLAVPVSEEVKVVLIAAAIDNPRRIKQFLNNYVVNYQLALEREDRGLVGKGVLTGRTDFLAKIIVILDRFPRFYDMLSKRDDLLFRIESYFRGEELGDFTGEDIDKIFKESPGLRWFLQRTRPIEVRGVGPFIRLAQETYESLLPEQEELKLRVRNNDHQYVKRLLEKAEEDKKTNIVKVMLKILEEDMRRQSSIWAFNELNVILETINYIPEPIFGQALNSFQYHCSSIDMLAHLPRFDEIKMFSLLLKMEEAYKNSIITEYCRLLVKDGTIDQGLLDLIVVNRKLVSQKAKDVFNESLVVIYEKNEDQGQEVIQTLIEQEEVRKDLLTSTVVMAIVSKLNGEIPLDRNKERVELYESVKDLASTTTRHEFVVGLLRLLPGKPPSAPDKNIQFVLGQLNKLENGDVPASVVEHLHDTLIIYMNAVANENHKAEFLPPLIRHMHPLPEDLRTQFLDQQIKPRFSSGQPPIVLKIIDALSDSTYNILDHEELLEVLVKRGKTNLVDARLIGFLVAQSPKDQKPKVSELLISHVESKNATHYNVALKAFGSNSQHLPRKEVDRVCSSIIETARSASPDTKPNFYQSLVEAYPNCSRDTQDRIVYEILELIKQTEPLRSKGIEYYRKLKEQIPDEMRRHVLRQLIINLSGTLDDQLRPSLDLIFENQEILEQDDIIRLIDYLRGQISTAQKEQTQIYSMKYLLMLSKLYKRGGGVLKAVLLVSKSGSQTVKDLGKKIHQTFNRYKVSDEHWKGAKEVFGEDVVPAKSA